LLGWAKRGVPANANNDDAMNFLLFIFN
jgi:hypothetical protein